MTSTVVAAAEWGTVPDYLVVLSILGGALSLAGQRRWERDRDAEARNRQARLDDLRQAWAALAPLVARPGGFDDDDLAQSFATAMRQLQLSGSEEVLAELEKVTSTLVQQGHHGIGMAVDLVPLIDAVRKDYRRLLDVSPTNRTYAPFAIVRRDVADQWRRDNAGGSGSDPDR